MDFIDNLANNDIFLTVLVVILILLVITFFVVLFLGGKKDKSKVNAIENKINENQPSVGENNIDFNHDEYVKEATLEFELSPVQDVKAVLSEVQLDKIEESPSYHVDAPSSVDTNEMKNFSFDELSKMISEELNNIEKNEALKGQVDEEEPKEDVKENPSKKDATIPQVTFVDTFKEVDSKPKEFEFKPLEKESIEKKEVYDSVFINKVIEPEKLNDVVLPKLAKDIKESNEPVLKEENIPLYARFNQESYDINEKD